MIVLKPWANTLSSGILAVNVCFLVFWLAVDRHATGPDHEVVSNSYDAISLQITILGIIITALALGLALASIFGYQALREVMLDRCDALVSQRLAALEKGGAALASGPSTPPTAVVAPAGATEEGAKL